MRDFPNWRIGLSSAAGWSWGVSLAVGMSILYTKGILPFMVWTTGNILALPAFALTKTYLPLSNHWPRFVFPIIILFIFVEFFCIVLNLQGLLSGFGGNVKGIASYQFLTNKIALYIVAAIGVFIVWYIHKGGLRISVLTDFGQYATQLIAVIFMASAGFVIGGENNVVWIAINPQTGVSGLEWAWFGFFGIIVGAIGASQHWQRFEAIEAKNVVRVSWWGAFFFGIYMVFVGLTGFFFTEHILLGLTFLIAMIALASSSIDSAVAGLEYVAGRLGLKPYIASLVGLLAVTTWFLTCGEKTIVSVWSFMAHLRLPTVAIFFVGTLFLTLANSPKVKEWLIKNGLLLKK